MQRPRRHEHRFGESGEESIKDHVLDVGSGNMDIGLGGIGIGLGGSVGVQEARRFCLGFRSLLLNAFLCIVSVTEELFDDTGDVHDNNLFADAMEERMWDTNRVEIRDEYADSPYLYGGVGVVWPLSL